MPDTTAPLQVGGLTVNEYTVHLDWVEPTGVPPLGGDIDRYDIYDTLEVLSVIPSGDPTLTVLAQTTEADVTVSESLYSKHYFSVVAVDTAENKSKIKSVSTRLARVLEPAQGGLRRSSEGFYIFL